MLAAPIQRLQAYLRRRKIAYIQTFNPKSVYAMAVLEDLAKFCRAHQTTFHKDERMSAVLEGRREVFLRISENLNLSLDEIYRLHNIKVTDEA